MRIVAALGGNALIRRGETADAAAQRRNLAIAAQVGLLAEEVEAAHHEGLAPLDVLDAETEGMVGYQLERELRGRLPGREVATLLTQIVVDPGDPAFDAPSKPVGPVYDERTARPLAAERGWRLAPDGGGLRRVVASPEPVEVLGLPSIERLAAAGTVVICAGGGGIPVARDAWGRLHGVEGVIDKDLASALLARGLHADMLLLLTDVDAVWRDWGTTAARRIDALDADAMRALAFPVGSMGPKVEAACRFVEATGGRAAIGALADADAIVAGRAGTGILPRAA
jgi:carbamate kinase